MKSENIKSIINKNEHTYTRLNQAQRQLVGYTSTREYRRYKKQKRQQLAAGREANRR